MDISGPQPKTFRCQPLHFFPVLDDFTKHAKAYALPDQKATTIERAFLTEFVSSFGVPYVIHTNQSANLESNHFKELCRFLYIKKTRTSPYHPQCDGQVKRIYRTLIKLLALNVNNLLKNGIWTSGLS